MWRSQTATICFKPNIFRPAYTRTIVSRALNEGSWRFRNHRDGPYEGATIHKILKLKLSRVEPSPRFRIDIILCLYISFWILDRYYIASPLNIWFTYQWTYLFSRVDNHIIPKILKLTGNSADSDRVKCCSVLELFWLQFNALAKRSPMWGFSWKDKSLYVPQYLLFFV